MVYVKQGLIGKRLESFETKLVKSIKLTFSKKTWCILFAHRPPKQSKYLFFQEIPNSFCSRTLKSKMVRGSQAPFMNKKLTIVITEKSISQNKYTKWPSS